MRNAKSWLRWPKGGAKSTVRMRESPLVLAEAAAQKLGDQLRELLGVGHSVGQGMMNKVPGLIISKEERRKSGAEASVARRCGNVSLSALRKLLQDVPQLAGFGMVAPASWGENVPVVEQTRIQMSRIRSYVQNSYGRWYVQNSYAGYFYLIKGEGERLKAKVIISTSKAASLDEPVLCSKKRVRLYSFEML